MNDSEIEQIIRDNIEKTVHMSLATASSDAPWVCEVHFAVDDDLNIYWRSLTSRRHSQEIAKNPKVAGNIVKQHELEDPVVGVYFEGNAELLGPGKDQNIAAECLETRMKKEKGTTLEEAANPDGHQFYKITVKNWYCFGRFGQPSGQKYQLEWGK